MKMIISLIATLLLTASSTMPEGVSTMLEGVSTMPEGRGPALDLCGCGPVFEDSFREMSIAGWELDGKRWMAHTPWRGDFGDAKFTDPGPGGPFSLRDGALQITARRDAGGQWRSGLIAAADASGQGVGVQYGYFEARMRLPPGPGTWPAFWLVSLQPARDKAPKVEINVMEYYGHATSSFEAAWHVWFDGAHHSLNRGGGAKIHVKRGSLVGQYHDYGANVARDWTTIYLDHKAVARMPTPPELTTPLYPLVNLALGPGYPIDKTPDPSVLSIGYVKIYRAERAGMPNRCPHAGAR